MSNSDTVKAIIANLAAVLAAQGFKIEDTSTDPKAETSAACVIGMFSESFEESFGQRPLYNELTFTLSLIFSDKNPGALRNRAADYIHKVRDSVNIDAINTGALATSKLVSWVQHLSAVEAEYDPPKVKYRYTLKIRYREV